MKINRYSQVTPSRYNPMTLEEIMMVPLMKRKQHDDLLNDIALTKQGLAQVDPLDIHTDVAMQEQDRLEKLLQAQAEEAASSGISNKLRGDFLSLNGEYQKAISPTGTLGRANSAKAALQAEKEAFIANDTKNGFSSADAEKNWLLHQQKYEQQYAADGKIKNIDALYAPNRVDYIAEYNEMARNAGLTSYDKENAKSYIEFDEEKGSYVLTEEGRRANANNDKNLEALTDWMTNRLYNKDSDLRKSIEHEFKTPDSVKDELLGMAGIYSKSETKEMDRSTISNYTPVDTKNDVIENGMGITASAEQYAPVKYDKMDQYKLEETIATLEAKENLTPADKKELAEMKQFKTAIDAQLGGIPEYKAAREEIASIEEELNAMQQGTYDWESNLNLSEQSKRFVDPGEGSELLKRNATKQKMESLERAKRKLSEVSEKHIEGVKLKMTSYQMTPFTTKQASILKIANENLTRLVKDNPQALEQMTEITEVLIDGNPVAVTSSRDKLGISEMFFNAPEGSIEFVNATPEGFTGLPEYTLRINPYKDMKAYDMDGMAWNDEVGADEAIQVRVAMKDITTGAARNINGLVQEYLASTGPEGEKLVESMRISSVYDKFMGMTWGEIENSVQIPKGSALEIIRDQKLRELGITSSSTDEEIAEKEKELQGMKFSRYE